MTGVPAHAEIVCITPEMAVRWLSRNRRNRPVRPTRIAHYSRLIRAGLWRLNGQPIILDKNGEIADGQHRLISVAETGCSIWSFVIYGVDPDAFETLDTGLPRTTGDSLTLTGETNGVLLSAALNLLWRYERGIWRHDGPPNPSTQELRDLLEEHPNIRDSIVASRPAHRLMAPRLATTLHYLFAQRDPVLAALYFDGLGTGATLGVDDGVRRLRERLIDGKASKAKLPQREILALAIKAWNAARAGAPVKVLSWKQRGSRPEPFPEIQ